MTQTQTHDLTFTATEVRKRYVSWDRGEADREWDCLTLLAEQAPGLAPRPLRRSTDGHAPVVVMERLRGTPLGGVPLTPAQTTSLGTALRQLYAVPHEAILDAGITERLNGPSTLPQDVTEWLSDSYDLTQCQEPGLVDAAMGAALAWLGRADSLPPPQLVALGIADLNPANIIWDGQTCRLVDFEDGGLTDPAYELADHTEHIAGRLGRTGPTNPVARRILDPEALVDAVRLSLEQRERMQCYRPLWAAFWLAMLLPGNSGFRKNPPGTTEAQAQYLLELLG